MDNSPSNHHKVKLIYISSNGRSGSTLLEMLIGKNSNCFSLGEFQMLPIDYNYNMQPCGCGEKLNECNFWTDIYRQNKKIIDKGRISKFRNFGNGKVLRWSELLDVFFGSSHCKTINEYSKDNFDIFSSILKKLNIKNRIEYLVDSSKDSYRLKHLLQSNYFEIKVIHILKKPEGFVFSMTKSENRHFIKWYFTIRMSIRWIIENLIIQRINKKYNKKKNYLKIRYEDLAIDTNNQLDIIFKYLNIENTDKKAKGYTHFNHAISGNKMRFNKQDIYLDEKWKINMGLLYKITCRLIVFPFRKLYKH